MRVWLMVASASLAFAIACGGSQDSPTGTGQNGNTTSPATISPTTSAPSPLYVGDTVASVFHVATSSGAAVAGASVSFSANGQATVLTSTAATDGSGNASTKWIASAAGSVGVNASVGSLSSTSVGTSTVAPAASITPLTLTDATALIGTAIPTNPSVTVLDVRGRAVVGIAVQFATTMPGAKLTGDKQTTDNAGRATIGAWVLGDSLGDQLLTATVAALQPAVFHATATNPWKVSTSSNGNTVFTQRAANEGSLFGDGALWASTSLIVAPTLGIFCTKTSGTIGSGIYQLDVEDPFLVTLNGTVTYQFDSGPRVASTWDQVSPSFSALFDPTSPGARALMVQMLAAKSFNISFREFGTSTLFAPVFDLRGLSAVIGTVTAGCPPPVSP